MFMDITSNGTGVPTVNGTFSGYVFNMSVNNVTIQGLRLTNATYGVYVPGPVVNLTVTQCNIDVGLTSGVYIDGCIECTLGGNFWSDLNGDDYDGNGIADYPLPYNFSGNITNGGDYMPLLALYFVQPTPANWNATKTNVTINVTYVISDMSDVWLNFNNYTASNVFIGQTTTPQGRTTTYGRLYGIQQAFSMVSTQSEQWHMIM